MTPSPPACERGESRIYTTDGRQRRPFFVFPPVFNALPHVTIGTFLDHKWVTRRDGVSPPSLRRNLLIDKGLAGTISPGAQIDFARGVVYLSTDICAKSQLDDHD
jgi:hypothetical protein